MQRPVARIGMICSLAAIIVSSADACVVWHHESVPPADSRAATKLPSVIRIVTAEGQTVTLWYAEVHGDTLIGERRGRYVTADSVRFAIAAHDVRRLDARRASLKRTALLVLGPPTVFVAIMAIMLPHGDQ